MADPNDTLDPEPVDAEFEPADDELPPESRAAKGGFSLGRAVILFAGASLAGGTLGMAGSQWLASNNTPVDPDAASERATLTQTITGLETRLAALESEDPAALVRDETGALDDRIRALEAIPPGSVDLSEVETRLTALETRPDTATGLDRVAALETRAAEIEASQLETRNLAANALSAAEAAGTNTGGNAVDPSILQNFSERLTALEASADEARPQSATTAEVEALQARIARLETALAEARSLAETAQQTATNAAETAAQPDGDSDAARQLAARALALTALRDMASTGGPFEAERAALSRLWRGNADIAGLASFSRSGAPTLSDLVETYPGSEIREAAGSGRHFFGLLEVRRVDPQENETDPLALTALAESRLQDGQLEAAVLLTEQLDGDPLEAARDWLLGARARLDTESRLAALRQSLASQAAEQGADPS